MRYLWKQLPKPLRNYFHKALHRLNSSMFLLKICKFRHKITARKISSLESAPLLRIGESRKFSGWVSTNYQVFTRYFLDATKYYGDQVCSCIYADNVIEHLDRKDGLLLIKRAYEALKSGGVLRITTPDLRSIVDKYLEGSSEDVQQFALDLQEHSLDIQNHSDLLRITFTAFGHHKGIIYDFETLKKLLESIGFVEIHKYVPGFSNNSNLNNLESRVGTTDMWSQMAVEATKP